jgi:SAM-dependent methyltransferase
MTLEHTDHVGARAWSHSHAPETVEFTPEFWDDRYRSAEQIWSGEANPRLVAVATDLAPGSALDVGSGEGADAIWLAARGWNVAGIDISQVALDRAAARAVEAGADIARRITWQQADVLAWEPPKVQFDLVSAQFMHFPPEALVTLHVELAAAVRPGGTLLIVGHHPSDLETSVGRRHLHDLMFTADQIAANLNPDDWQIVATTPERTMLDPDGQLITIHDAVVRAVRQH